jgi:hypothetical protein
MYTVAQITTPDGYYFTARADNRTHTEVVADGISGFKHRGPNPGKIYESLNQHQVCFVKNIFEGLDQDEAEAKKKTLIEYHRAIGSSVLNGDRA